MKTIVIGLESDYFMNAIMKQSQFAYTNNKHSYPVTAVVTENRSLFEHSTEKMNELRITSTSQSRAQGTRINGIFCERIFIDLFQIIEYLSKANQFLLMTFCVSIQIVFCFSIYSCFFPISCMKILSLIFFSI